MGSIKDRLQVIKPTIFLGVPLVWEKIADKVKAIGAAATGAKKAVATFAKAKGLEYAKNCQLGGTGAYPPGFGLVNAVVLAKIKEALGLECCSFGLTGAAPMRVDTLEYYGSIGIGIMEVYGMSESTGVTTMNNEQAHAWGSCGWELPGVEVRAFKVNPDNINDKTPVPEAPSLDETDEKYMGELCFRGRHIMMGYMAQPALGKDHVAEINKKTAEAIDNEGWMHSGDKGLITVLGMTKITGRYKELIIGDGGENIAPVPIEDVVKKTCEGVNEVMMIGDKRKYNVALITLKAVGANGEIPGTDQLDAAAARLNPQVQTITGAIADQMWIEAVTAAVTAANNDTKVCINQAFKIQKFCILPTNFSEEMGELTPTKKLKRKQVETRYAALIDRMYADKGVYIPFTSADAPKA
jgi:long-chain-fatty-acid--CoA ligase ACSBG